MLKQEIEALLKIEHGEGYTLKVYPVRLKRSSLRINDRFDWRYRRTIYWIGELDTKNGGFFVTKNYHLTNHGAAKELYRTYTLCK
jgi:hypothetical protein